MSKAYLTYNGVTKPVADWGLSIDAVQEKVNQGKHTVTVTSIERFDAAPQFAFKAPVTIYETDDPLDAPGNRKIWFQGFVALPSSVTEDGVEYKEYTFYNLWWILERITYRQNRVIGPGMMTYQPPGAAQQWVAANDQLTPDAPADQLVVTTPELYLFIDNIANVLISTGLQITNALQWANTIWNPTRRGSLAGIDVAQDLCIIGTIDPNMLVPIAQASSLSCAEVIRESLKPHPTASVIVDYSTTPPTVNVRLSANQVHKTLAMAGIKTQGFRMRARNDLVPSAVAIWYKFTGSVVFTPNTPAVAAIQWVLDIWPVPAAGNALLQPDVTMAVIELQGTNTTTAHINLKRVAFNAAVTDAGYTFDNWPVPSFKQWLPLMVCVGGEQVMDKNGNIQTASAGTTGATIPNWPVNAGNAVADGSVTWTTSYDPLNTAANATRTAWWANEKKVETTSPNIPAGTIRISPASVTDFATGNPVNLAQFKWELQGGEHPKNYGAFNVVRAQVRAMASWQVFTDKNQVIKTRAERKWITVNVLLTDAALDDYYPITSNQTAEPMPVGLAQALFNEWTVLQHDGAHRASKNILLANNDTIDQGDIVDTTGLITNYAGLMVQGAVHYLGKRQRKLTFGVPEHLSISDYIRMMMLWRFRYRWHNPSEAATGQPAGASQIDLGTEHPIENSDDGAETPASHSASSPDATDPTKTNVLGSDAASGQTTMQQVNTATGENLAVGIIPPLYVGTTGGAPGPLTLQ